MIMEFLEFVRSNFGVISTGAAIVAGGFWLKLDSKYAKKSDVELLRKTIEENDDRLTKIENKVDNLPTSSDFAQLQILMTKIEGEAKSTNTRVKAIGHQVGLLLENKLLNRKE